jgi:hypothetical protein
MRNGVAYGIRIRLFQYEYSIGSQSANDHYFTKKITPNTIILFFIRMWSAGKLSDLIERGLALDDSIRACFDNEPE